MQLKDLVHNWLLGGADPEVGLRLFMDYTNPSNCIARLISKNPSIHIQTIKISLLKASGLNFELISRYNSSRNDNTVDSPKTTSLKLRNQWPFLSDPECPPELKLLISDKISAYTICVKEYENMINASNVEEQLKSVHLLVSNFIENHGIYQELKHYSVSKKVLGKHQIFDQYQKIKDLRKLNTLSLFDKKKNLEHAIWRNESKIKKDKRDDLLNSRLKKVKELKMQLAEVLRLLE